MNNMSVNIFNLIICDMATLLNSMIKPVELPKLMKTLIVLYLHSFGVRNENFRGNQMKQS